MKRNEFIILIIILDVAWKILFAEILIIEVFLSTKVLIKRLTCTSVAIKAYILTDLSEDVQGGLGSKCTTSMGLPCFESSFFSMDGKSFLILWSLPEKAI